MFSLYAGVSLGVSTLVLLLIALKPLLKKRYSARWGYLTWILLCFILVIPLGKLMPQDTHPLVISLPAKTFDTSTIPQVTQTENTLSSPITTTPAVTPSSKQEEKLNFWDITNALWILGMAVYLLYFGVSYAVFQIQFRKVKKELPDDETAALYRKAEEAVKPRRKAKLLIVQELPSPMLMGFLRPTVLLPKESIGCPGLEMILRHELVHLKRNDLYVKLFAAMANAIHWFNPFAYILRHQLDVDCEFSCDERVLQGEPIENRICYGEAVLAVVRATVHQRAVFTTSFNSGKETTKMRLHNILYGKAKKAGILALVVLLLAAIVVSSIVVFADDGIQAPFFGTIKVPNSITKIEQRTDEYGVNLYIGDQLVGGAKTEAYNEDDPDGLPIPNDAVDNSRNETTLHGFKAFDTVLSSLTTGATEQHYYVIDKVNYIVYDFYGINPAAPADLAKKLAKSWHYTAPSGFSPSEGFTAVPLDMEKQNSIQQENNYDALNSSTVAQEFADQYFKDAGITVTTTGIISNINDGMKVKNPIGKYVLSVTDRIYFNPDTALDVLLIQPRDTGDNGIWAVIGYRITKPFQILPDLPIPTTDSVKSSAMYCIGKNGADPTYNFNLAEEFLRKMEAGTPAQLDMINFSQTGEYHAWMRLSFDGKKGTAIGVIPRSDGGFDYYTWFDFTKLEIRDATDGYRKLFYATMDDGTTSLFYVVVPAM